MGYIRSYEDPITSTDFPDYEEVVEEVKSELDESVIFIEEETLKLMTRSKLGRKELEGVEEVLNRSTDLSNIIVELETYAANNFVNSREGYTQKYRAVKN